MDENKRTSKITKVILNDLQGRKRVVGHDFREGKIKKLDETKEKITARTPKKRKQYKPLSTPIIAIICTTLLGLLGVGAYSYNKMQDRKKVLEMINQAQREATKTTNFYKKEIDSFNKTLSTGIHKKPVYKSRKQST